MTIAVTAVVARAGATAPAVLAGAGQDEDTEHAVRGNAVSAQAVHRGGRGVVVVAATALASYGGVSITLTSAATSAPRENRHDIKAANTRGSLQPVVTQRAAPGMLLGPRRKVGHTHRRT